jgi:hypothetical protein
LPGDSAVSRCLPAADLKLFEQELLESSMISLDCFACRSKITAPDQAAGRTGKCPKCGALILFPSPTLNLQVSPPAESKPESKPELKVQKFKKKKFAKKEASRFPVYMACGTLAFVAVLGIASWIGISVYLERDRTRRIEDQDVVAQERKRSQEQQRNSFLEEKQRLDDANLKIMQKKQEKEQAALEELDRKNRELKEKKEQAAEQAAKEFRERFEQQAKEAQEKEKAAQQEKNREAQRRRQQEMIDEDHKTILAYARIYIKSNIKDMYWSPPLRAMSKNKKEGLLYRLQGVVGQTRKPVSYYFLVVNRGVVDHEPAKNNDAVTICKIIGDLDTP